MRKLKDYEKDLKTCSKCGLCQSVCPVYKLTGKETIVSRGKFNLLLGLIKGELKYTKKLDEALSLCLHCKACDDFCPSSIKATEIISAAKSENKNYCGIMKYSPLFKFNMTILGLIFKTYRVLNISKITAFFKDFILKFGFLGRYFLLFDKISKINVKRKKTAATAKSKFKVIYFEGCFTKYLNPSTKNALLNYLEKQNVKIIQKNFECCGLSALYSGNYAKFERLKEKNIKLLSEDCDYIVCDCATCLSALKEYGLEFSKKVIDISELIKICRTEKDLPEATYHMPCHLREEKSKLGPIIKGLFKKNYKKMENYDVCCGFAGDFSLKYPKLSKEIMKQKALGIEQTEAPYVLTSCPGCIIGLNKGLIDNNLDKKVLSLIEFIEMYS